MAKPGLGSLAAAALGILVAGCGTSASRGGEYEITPAPDDVATEGPVRARLVADVTHVAPGQEFTLAVELDLDEGWLVHWSAPGDVGEPTRVAVRAPDGFVPGQARFPGPERVELADGSVRFGYRDRALISIPVVAADELGPGELELVAEAEWLACDSTICEAGHAEPAISLPIASPETPSRPAHEELFASHQGALPIDLDEFEGAATSWQLAGDGRVELIIDVNDATDLVFFPAGDIGLVGQAVTPADRGKALRLWLESPDNGGARGVIPMTRGDEVAYLRVALAVPDDLDGDADSL
jgi:DsbC/DsbD-like thiol-disulfide interchange protein